MLHIKQSNNASLMLNQKGQSMTQYLILTFMLAVGSLVTVGNASKAGRHQVAAVTHEVAGDHAGSIRNTSAAKQNSGYASASASLPYSIGRSSPSNPVTNPTDDPNTVPANPSDIPPSIDPNNPITNPSDTGGTTDTGDTDILPPPLCTATTPEEDNGDTKSDEDEGFWGSLWSEIKDGLVEGYEFVKGFWEGMKNQVSDLADLLANPIETAKGLIALGKQFVENPSETAAMIAESLGEEFSTLVHCGAFDKGRVIGENVSPAFMVKLASKMVKFGNLSEALADAKKDFGCASFAADTPIWTLDGKVSVQSLIKNDIVLSRNEKGYQDKPQKITNTFGRTAEYYYELKTEFDTIKVTAEHPIWKQGRGWTEAQYLKVDDVVASADGDVLILDNQKIEDLLQVYNFSVDNTPSYFAGESKLWVHNAACDINPYLNTPNGIKKFDELSSPGGNNLGLDAEGLNKLLNSKTTKGEAWSNPDAVLDAVKRASDANLDGVTMKGFPTPADGSDSFVLNNAKQFQKEASGDALLSFDKNGRSFDNVTPDGTLIDRKYGHGKSIFNENLDGTVTIKNQSRIDSAINQAREQIIAADGSPVRWEISTELGAKGLQQVFSQEGINVDVVFVPQQTIIN